MDYYQRRKVNYSLNDLLLWEFYLYILYQLINTNWNAIYACMQKYMLANLERLLLILDNKVRFILGVVNGEIIMVNRKKAELLIELKQKGFTPMLRKGESAEPQVVGANDESSEGATWGDYEYFLSLPIGTLTLESVQKLLDEKAEKEKEHEVLMGTPTKSLWLKDLDEFEKKLDVRDNTEFVYLYLK